MESTGSYWKPVFNLPEPVFQVIVVNVHQIKQVPGAAIAVAHTMLVIIYTLLKQGTTYQEIAADGEAA